MDTFEHITDFIEQAFDDQPVWREHALIRKLQQDDIEPISSFRLSNTLELFKVHFLVRHGIYQLRERWRNARKGDLSIGTIEIISIPYPEPNLGEADPGAELRETDLLELYYRDLSNYFNTSEAEVDLLLKGFWQRLKSPEESAEALETLGLEKGASYHEIKLAFRRHAQQLHPDKGGDEQAFKTLTEARDTLLAQTTKS